MEEAPKVTAIQSGRELHEAKILNEQRLAVYGLTPKMIASAVSYTYAVLDSIDSKMADFGESRLSTLVELANLSSMIGNLFGRGIAKFSDGKFERNKPHTYPDLLAKCDGCTDFEIKIALENNKPKGHLVKPGPHVTIRYVLAPYEGIYTRGKEGRGDVVWIWEVRVGDLEAKHFNVSNTEGDSGKTAVINADGMNALSLVYVDLERCPLSTSGSTYKTMKGYVDHLTNRQKAAQRTLLPE